MELFSEHLKNDHMLSQVDARLKIFISLVILAMILSCKGFVLSLFTTVLCLFFCFMMKTPARVLLMRFAEPLFIASIVLILKFFFAGDKVLFSLDVLGLKIIGHKDGLYEGLMIACRIVSAVSIVAVISLSTPFTEFMAGLSWFRVPKGFIDILIFSYRYIFVLLEDAVVIYNAQKNRLGYSTIKRGLGSFGTLTGALILKAFEHSNKITVSMMQRGYDGNIPSFRQRPLEPAQIIISALFITVMGVVWKMQ